MAIQAAALAAQNLGSLFGWMSANSQQKWDRNALVNVLNTLNQANQTGLGLGLGYFNPANDAAQELLTRALMFNFGNDGQPGALTGLNDTLNATREGLTPGAFNQNVFQTNPGYLQPNIDNLQAIGAKGDPFQQMMLGILSGGGRTDDSGNLSARLMDIVNGQGAQLGQMGDTGFNLLTNPGSDFTRLLQGSGGAAVQNGGFNPNLNRALGSAFDVVSAGGSNPNMDAGIAGAMRLFGNGGNTPGLDMLRGAGANSLQGNLGVAGLTPTGAMGETTALGGLQAGGATPFTQFMQSRGADLAGKDAVLPTLLATDLARNEATTQYANAARAARTQAVNRGGAPGATVANGATNEALADFSDQAAQGIASNVANTLVNQQGLNLQQQKQGADMGLQAGNLEAGRLNNFGDLLQGLEGVATSRFGVGGNLLSGAEGQATQNQGVGLNALTNLSGLQSENVLRALGLVPQIQNSATNNMGTAGQLGLGAGQLDLANLSEGGNLLQAFNQLRLSGANNLTNLLGQENQFNLGAGSLFNQSQANQGNIFNNLIGAQLSGQQLGSQNASAYYNVLNDILKNQLGVAGLGTGLFSTAFNPLLNMGNSMIDYARTGLSGIPGLFTRGTYNSEVTSNTNNLASALGQALQTIFSKGSGGGGGD